MTKRARLRVALAVLGLVALCLPLASCGGGGGSSGDETNNWDAMVWDVGVWQ